MALLQSLGYAPIYGINEFPTLRYYEEMFLDKSFRISLFYTFYYSLVPTIVGTALSIYLALALRKRFKRNFSSPVVGTAELCVFHSILRGAEVRAFTTDG